MIDAIRRDPTIASYLPSAALEYSAEEQNRSIFTQIERHFGKNPLPDGISPDHLDLGFIYHHIQDVSLTRVWERIWDPSVMVACPKDASAEKIRTWMLSPENEDALNRIEVLNLSKLDLLAFPPELKKCTQVKKLLLFENRIRALAADAFANFRELKSLSLRANLIKVLPEPLLHEIQLLRQLDLKDNRLREIPAAFLKCKPCLDWVSFSHNLLESVPPETLIECQRLTAIDFSHNRIQCIFFETFRGCGQLRDVILSHNRIRCIPFETFRGCGQLRDVILSHNRIQEIPESTFDECREIELVELSYNRFSKIPSFKNLRAMKKLEFAGNPLDLSSCLRWTFCFC